ncbi:MAG: hypothetical protein IKM20_10000 [Erysipelotrichales bacterium]|nr:hypothetical protein [Erysipelotrichales bacterium]
MKLRKMLGSVDDDSCIKLMKLIETQSIATLFSWAVSYVEVNILPVLNNHYNESEKVFNYINQVKAYINSEVKLKDIKPVLKNLRELAKATNDNPITQAALRTIATACAVVTTPTNALGLTFYALATKIYHEFGLECEATFYDLKASEYYKDIVKSLEDVAISNEENPVKVNWNC